MSEYNFIAEMKEDNKLLFKRSIRKLFESTFILKDREEKLYYFVAKESNRRDISDYLKMIGFDILVDDKCNIAMLVANEDDESTVGLKRANVISFSPLQFHLLLILWEVYLENIGYEEENYVLKGDLIDKIKTFGLIPAPSELKVALKLFKKYSLINFNDNETGEDSLIRLYPSLQFGWDLPQFKAVVDGHLKKNAVTEKDEVDHESDETELEYEESEEG